MSKQVFERILLYYSMWQNIEFYEGLSDPTQYAKDNRPKLLILDDLLLEASDTGDFLNLFYFHHGNTSIFFTSQNLYHKGKNHRDISLNSNYLVLHKYETLHISLARKN